MENNENVVVNYVRAEDSKSIVHCFITKPNLEKELLAEFMLKQINYPKFNVLGLRTITPEMAETYSYKNNRIACHMAQPKNYVAVVDTLQEAKHMFNSLQNRLEREQIEEQ